MKYLTGLFSLFVLLSANSYAFVGDKTKKQPSNAALKNVNTVQLTKRTAANQVKKKFPGKVLNVKENAQFYKVRMLRPQGKVVDFKVQKSNGKIKKDKKNNANFNN